MNAPVVVRVQDSEGRGPWRPGFSAMWTEERDDFDALKPWVAEFGLDILRKRLSWESVGCGCRTVEQLRRWFTDTEYQRLLGFGFQAVRLEASRILAESDLQLVFVRSRPLSQGAEAFDLYTPIPPSARKEDA